MGVYKRDRSRCGRRLTIAQREQIIETYVTGSSVAAAARAADCAGSAAYRVLLRLRLIRTRSEAAARAWRTPRAPRVQHKHLPMMLEQRPRVRSECVDGPRPCPWASCRHHLGVDVRGTSVVEMQVDETCSLDLADSGDQTLEHVGALLDVTRERVRQIQAKALRKLRSQVTADEIADLLGDDVAAAVRPTATVNLHAFAEG